MSSPVTSPRSEVARLFAFGRRVRGELIVGAVGRFSGVLLTVAFASLLLDRWWRFGPATLDVLRVAALIGLVWSAWKGMGALLWERPSVLGWAALIDRGRGGDGSGTYLTQRFATLLEFEERSAEDALARSAAASCRAELEAYDYDSGIDRDAARRRRVRLAGLWALPLLVTVLLPGTTWTWARRWLLGSEASWPQETHLVLDGVGEDGTLMVPRGEAVELRVHAESGSVIPDDVSVRYRAGDRDGRGAMTAFAPGDFRFQLPGLAEDGQLWIRGGDDRLGPIPLRVRDRPRLLEARLTATLEAAGFESTATFVRGEDLGYLSGTVLSLELRADQDLGELRLGGMEGLDPLLGGPDGTRRSIEWTHTRAAALWVELVSSETGLSSHPWDLAIGMRVDRAPRVSLARVGVRDRVTPTARVPLELLAQDDHGVAGLRLDLVRGAYASGAGDPLWGQELLDDGHEPQPTVEARHVVRLEGLGLEVGQVATFTATATDASHLGAQSVESRPIVLRIVDPGGLMAEVSSRLELARARLRQSWEEAREIEDELEAGEPIGSVSDLLRRHRVIDRTVWRTRRILDDSLTELSLNALISEESETLLRQRAFEPLELLAEETMRDQRAGLERRLAGEEVGVPALLRTQKLVVEDMKRVLDGLAGWDSFVDLVNHLNEIIRLEEQVRGDTRGAR